MRGFSEYFLPCIDIHEGRVKQIVGSTLSTGMPQENYIASQDILHFTTQYARYGLTGGHIIMLDRGEATQLAARKAVENHPGTYQVGGGMDPERGMEWLSRGAEKVIVSSYLFEGDVFREDRLEAVARRWGSDRLVVDISSVRVDGQYRTAIHGWKTITDLILSPETLGRIGRYCEEILIHAIAHEGMREGIDADLLSLLEECCPVPFVYAGGIHSLEEVSMICKRSQERQGRIGFTVGSGLDLFGGDIPLEAVLEVSRSYR